MSTKRKYTYIDLFAGTSALSEGFLQCGFQPVSHIEMNSDACLTIKTRTAYHYLKNNNKLSFYRKYLKSEISRDELYGMIPEDIINSVINTEISDITVPEIFKTIDTSLSRRGEESIDFIIGGPPCQAFSLLNRHTNEIEK